MQALKKHPGDRPTVMEMLHHPWIRTYQRRTSVLMPHQAVRRRSSVQYQAAAAGPLQPPPEGGPLPGAPDNVDNMTPEDIEKMIQRLQVRLVVQLHRSCGELRRPGRGGHGG